MSRVGAHIGLGFPAAVLALLGTSISVLDRDYWISDLLANLRVHLAFGTVLLGLLAAVLRHRPTLALSALAFVVNAVSMIAPIGGSYPEPGASGLPLRVLTVNVSQRNEDYRQVIDFLAGQSADVVVVQEVTPAWVESLKGLDLVYPFLLAEPSVGSFGIAMLSRREPSGAGIRYFRAGGIPFAEMRFESDGVPVTVVGVHLSWPMVPVSFRARNAQLEELAGLAAIADDPVVVCGDFNLTVWSGWFSRFLEQGRFMNASLQPARAATWPAAFPLGGISIDHCVSQEGVSIGRRHVGPAIGSDHRPVLYEMRVSAPEPGS